MSVSGSMSTQTGFAASPRRVRTSDPACSAADTTEQEVHRLTVVERHGRDHTALDPELDSRRVRARRPVCGGCAVCFSMADPSAGLGANREQNTRGDQSRSSASGISTHVGAQHHATSSPNLISPCERKTTRHESCPCKGGAEILAYFPSNRRSAQATARHDVTGRTPPRRQGRAT
jgi:hypothetical protein